ncbi:MAG: hypothetical protein WCP14_00745 [bacterium]
MKDFEVAERLYSVNGPDGSGKTIFVRYLAAEMASIAPTIVVKPSLFSESSASRSIGDLFAKDVEVKKDSRVRNTYFLETLSVNYRDRVIPLLEQGYCVILDSSEIRDVAFTKDISDELAHSDTLEWVQSGKLTHRTVAKHQVFLYSEAEDLFANILARGEFGYGDPRSLEEAERRLLCYQEAFKLFRLMAPEEVNWHYLENPRVLNFEEQLRLLSRRVIEGASS